MNTIKRKFLSSFLALTMIVPAFTALTPPVFADEYDGYEDISLLADETVD